MNKVPRQHMTKADSKEEKNPEINSETLLSLLKKEGPLATSEILSKLGIPYEERTRRKVIRILKKERRVGKKKKKIEVSSREKRYFLEVFAWYLKKPKPLRKKAFRPQKFWYRNQEQAIRLHLRERHLARLKEEVIKPWLRQVQAVRLVAEDIELKISGPSFELPVENEPLFLDLKTHIERERPEQNPYEIYELFKEKAAKFLRKKEEFEELAQKWLRCFGGWKRFFQLFRAKTRITVLEEMKRYPATLDDAEREKIISYFSSLKSRWYRLLSEKADALLKSYSEVKDVREKLTKVLKEYLAREVPFTDSCKYTEPKRVQKLYEQASSL